MKVSIEFDLGNLEERELLEHVLDSRNARGISRSFIRDLKRTKSGKVAMEAAKVFNPDQEFTIEELANVMKASQDEVRSWLRHLGRTEKRYSSKVFKIRWDVGESCNYYHLSPEMHTLLVQDTDG